MSMMTSHNASGSGVNCPWKAGVTMQSSISPKRNKTNILVCMYVYISRILMRIYVIDEYFESSKNKRTTGYANKYVASKYFNRCVFRLKIAEGFPSVFDEALNCN